MANLFSGVKDPLIQGTGSITDYQTSAGERFASELEGAFDTNPLAQGARMARYAIEANAPFFGLESNMVSPEVAREELKSRGLEGHITVPEGGMSRVEFDSIQYLKQRELSRQAKSAMNQSTFAHIAGFAGGLVGSAVDPINIASAFVPIVPEARIASMLGKAGSSVLGRAAVRSQVGATEGVVGALMIEPFTYAMSQYEQMDYTPADSFMNVVFGGLLGGGLHMAGGAVYDWRATRALNSLQRGLDGMNLRDMAPDLQDEVQLDILRRFTEAEENGAPLPDADEIIAQRMTPDQRSAVQEADGMPGEVPTPTRADGEAPQPRGLNELIPEAKADRTAETFNRQFLDKEQGDVAGFSDVRPPREDIFEVAQANFAGMTQHTAKTVPIDQLSGGVSTDPAETKRVNNLVELMSGPNGYLERLIVDTDGNVIEGQHRLEALRKMGIKEVPVIEIRDLREGLPVDQMMDAMRQVRGLHREQAGQIVDQIAEAIADVGSVSEVRAQYAPPRGFERAWEAALNAAETADDLKAQSAPAKDASGKFTEAFWRWFKDSKVVDADGNPLVVYHGTGGNITEFKKRLLGSNTKAKSARGGFFFTSSPKNAEQYAGGIASSTGPISSEQIIASWPDEDIAEFRALEAARDALKPKGARSDAWMMTDEWRALNGKALEAFDRLMEKNNSGWNIMPLYLSIKDPLVHDMRGEQYREVKYADLVAKAKAGGHDGLIIKNTYDPEFGDVFVAFEPTQIKSATGNRGTYDPELADIRAQSDEDYRGQHRAPTADGGAPLHDLTGGGSVYPDDVYGPKAVQYYGTGNEEMDRKSFSIAMQFKGNPNAAVTIYRAVPHKATKQERIDLLETQMRKYQARGVVPDGATLRGSAWYNDAYDRLAELKALPDDASEKIAINPGDWVTINRDYAKEHGESALNGEYKIISKRVKAKQIYTAGDSIHEWGYDPVGIPDELADIRAQSDIVDDAAGPNNGLTPYTQSLGGQTDVNQPQSPDVLGTQETGLRLLTGVRRSPGILPPSPAWSDTAPLAFLPTTVKVPGVGTIEAGAFPLARKTARDYVESTGRAYDPITTYRKVDPARAGRIAEAFEQMRHEPDNPEVKAAYEAMVKETLAQWEAVKRTGLVVEFIDISKGDPYAASPRLATEDVRNNNHLWVFATDDGFGTDGITAKDESDNPLFQIVPGEKISGKQVRANDIFRIVHDYFGHIKDGVGFRADGEENAWRSHSRMYSPLAARAMTTETRGQNSWLNYGPYGEKNRTALTQDTIFAEQKIGLLPDWVMWEGLDDLPIPVPEDRTLADELGFGDLKMMGEPLDPADGPDAPKVIGTDAAGRPVLDFRNSVVSHFTDQESADNINEFGYRVVGDGYYGEAISFTPDRSFGAQFGGVETTARISPDARILNTGVPEDAQIIQSVLNNRHLVPNNPRPGMRSWRQEFLRLGIDGVYDPGAGDLSIYNERVVRPTAMDGLDDLKTMIGSRATPAEMAAAIDKSFADEAEFTSLMDEISAMKASDVLEVAKALHVYVPKGTKAQAIELLLKDRASRLIEQKNRQIASEVAASGEYIDTLPITDIKAQSDVDESGAVMDEDGNLATGLQYPIADRSEWYGDANYKNTGGRIVQMTPDEFLAQVRPLEIDESSRENIDILKQHILAGKTLDPLQISRKGKEDGRHRAYAAKELGIASVPVIVWKNDVEGIDIIDKFQSDLDEQPDLVAAHNLTAANLLHADKMGGIAAPSLAITKASDGHEGYGEITLIGSKDLVDPQKGANVYAGDIYSARYPTVHYNIKYESLRKLDKQFAATAKEMGVTLRDTLDDDALEREGPRALENSVGALLAYAKEKGVKVDGYLFDRDAWEVRNNEAQAKERAIRDEWQAKRDEEQQRAKAEGRDPDETALDAEMQPKYMEARREANSILREPDRALDEIKYKLRDKFRNDSGFAEWAEGKFAELKAKERIFKGFSNTTGARMYTAHTLDNVVKLMTKKIRDAEGFNYGIGNLRAKVAPKFRSVEAIRGRKGSLVKREEFDAIKKEADAELISIADQLLPKLKYKGNSFGQLDALTQHMAEAIDRNNVKRVFQEYYNNLTDDDVRMVGNFLQKLKTMPTTYFEAKLDRAVQIGEFEAAIVPNTISKKAREVLERSGVKQIIEYDPAVDGSRQAAIDSIRDMKFQSDLMRDLGFFSAMEKSIKDADLKSGTGAQWLGYLKNRPGVKAEEMDNSGISDFLTENANEKLTKEQVLQHAKDNAVELEEVTLGAFLRDPENVKPDAEAVAKYQDQWRALAVQRNAAYRKQREAETALDRVAAHKYELEVQDLDDEMNGLSDIMVQETIERAKGKHNVSGQSKYDEYTLPGGKDYREVLLTLPGTSGAFKSTHFNQHNIIAHARISDRVTESGKKALHVEEIQSDWHQAGRDRGYGLSDAERKSLETRRQQLEDEGQKARKAGQEFPAELKAEWAEIMNRLQRDKNAVPQAPFKKTWHELMIKRLIRMAVEKGYDEIIITRGQDIADRFDISNRINTLTYRKDNGLYEIAWEGPNGTSGVASHGALESELPGIVGKELAAKIVAGEGKPRGSGAARVTDLTGLDLKIGGEGMRGFYDKIVPDYLNKYGKKYGAKVGTDMINTKSVDADLGVVAVHAFPITDAMRTEVMKGQMLFQRDVVDVNAKDTVVAGPYTYTKMDTERRQRSEALRDAIEDLITKYTGGRAQMRWYSSISQKAGGKIHKVDGGFSSLRGLIIMALDAADMVGSAKHEALHFLKDRGLISDMEWDTLVRTALREGWMDKKYGGSKLTVRQRYAHLPNMLDILEEAIAEQFRAGRYDNFQGFHPAIRPILIKLRKFFDAVAKEARKIFGMEATAEDIFRAIESGEIGRRADVEKAKVEAAAIMDAPQRSAPQQMKNQSTPEEDPLRVDRWAADDIAIAAEAYDDSKRKDETLQDIEADTAILGAHLDSMRQRGLLSQEDEADLLASNDTARMMEEQAAAYEAAGICEGEE